MAISLHAAGSWAYAASGSVTSTLPTHSTGDMLLVRVAYKSSAIATCAASTATSGWALVSTEFHNGTTNSGNGTGSVAVATFWKQAASASETNPTIDFSQTVTQVGHVSMSYSKAADEVWATPIGDGGPDTTSGTTHIATIQSHVSVTVGDLIDFFTGIADDTTMTVPTFTQTGATLDAVTESPAAAGTDTSGADGAYDGGFRKVTAGTSSAAAVVTGTLSTSETGSSWTTRLRVTVATDANAGSAGATGAANLAGISVSANAGRAQVTATAQPATQTNASAGHASAVAIAAGSDDVFPTSALTVTDNFNRANETPIASPWDLTDWTDYEANLVSNQVQFPGATFGGGATWGTSYVGNFEVVVEVTSDLTASSAEIDIGVAASGLSPAALVSLTDDRVSLDGYGIGGPPTGISGGVLVITQAIGDLLGIRRIGSLVEGWYRSASGSWQRVGAIQHANYSVSLAPYLTAADSSDRYVDNFRVADYVTISNPAVSPSAGLSNASVLSNDATTTSTGGATNANAELAATAADAQQSSAGVSPTGGVASVSATALDATSTVQASIGSAAAAAAANSVTSTVEGSTNVADGNAAAQASAAGIAPTAGMGQATAAALDATVTTAADTNATAEVAAVSAAANMPAASVSPNALAAAVMAVANNPSISVQVTAGTASAIASAHDATVSTAVFTDADAGLSSVAATAYGATTTSTGGSVNANAGIAQVTATAYGATVKKRRASAGQRIERIQRTNVYPQVAQVTARAHDAKVEWNDDEAALLLLLDGML